MDQQFKEIELAKQRCSACEGNAQPLDAVQVDELMSCIRDDDWQAVNHHHLFRAFHFPNFKKALGFVNQVGDLAENEGHHPDILLGWGKAEITLLTHSIGALSMNDFVLAAKISEVYRTLPHNSSE